MKKRLLLIVIFSFIFICGYMTDYEVIVDDSIHESINLTIYQDDKEKYNSPALSFITKDQYALLNQDKSSLYNKKIEDSQNATKVNLQYDYSFKQFSDSKYLNTCFGGKTYINKSDYIYFRGYDGFYCLSQKELWINITTDKLVMKHNANSVKDNTYTWKVNENNAKDFEMEVQISTNKNQVEQPNSDIQIIGVFKIVIGVILAIAIIIIYIILRKQHKRVF